MELKIAFCGDVMLGAEVDACMGTAKVGDWVAGVSRIWQDADLLIGNLESPCVTNAKPIKHPLPELVLHAPSRRLHQLRDVGFSCLTLANNHMLDCGPLGLHETIQELDRVGIHHAGAGMDVDEATKPAFMSVKGITAGVVAFTYDCYPATRGGLGVASYEPATVRKSIAEARSQADLVIAILHDGLEYSDVPPSQIRARYRFMAENGADIVVGHHPHVLQGLEWHNGVPIAYSLGDLLFHNSLPHVAKRNLSRMAMGRYAPEHVQQDPQKFNRGAILKISISGLEKTVEWCPFRQGPNLRPYAAVDGTRLEDLRRIEDLSAALANVSDPRHELADSVFERMWWDERDTLSAQALLKLALRPQWRYVPNGLKWLLRKVTRQAVTSTRSAETHPQP